MRRLFGKRIEIGPTGGASPTDVTMESQPPGSGLYVDTENLQHSAQSLVETVIGQWPEGPRQRGRYLQKVCKQSGGVLSL